MSSYEYRRLQFLENCGQVIWFSTKHNVRILYAFEGSEHVYIPDIHVRWKTGEETIEEIKGFVRNQLKFEAKNNAARSWCDKNNKKFHVLFEKDLKKVW